MKVFHDKTGRRIKPGDLLKSFHFTGARRKKYYTYHWVGEEEGKMFLYHVDYRGLSRATTLTADYARSAEIIQGYGPPGDMDQYSHEDRPNEL